MVVAIIAILVALLLPALNKAKEMAKMAQCSSNNAQLSTAWHSYAIDCNGILQTNTAQISPWNTNYSWASVLKKYTNMSVESLQCPLGNAIRQPQMAPTRFGASCQ